MRRPGCPPYQHDPASEGGRRPVEVQAFTSARISSRTACATARHVLVDGRRALYEDHLSYLIKGNVLRGGVYPLCVGPERITQARKIVAVARETGARAVAHGSTGAGNDQVRFDVALRMLADDLDVLTPIRSLALNRAQTTAFLRERGFDVPEETTAYSINRGTLGHYDWRQRNPDHLQSGSRRCLSGHGVTLERAGRGPRNHPGIR